MSEELKECPFCGNEITIRRFGANRVDFHCPHCNINRTQKTIHLSIDHLIEKMIADWNIRPIEDALREQLEELQKKYDAYMELVKTTNHIDHILCKQLNIAMDAMNEASIALEKLELPKVDDDEWQIAHDAHIELNNALAEIKHIGADE